MKRFIFLSTLLTLFVGCCKDCTDPTNPDCSNYDPCYGKVYTADFDMYQEFTYKASSEYYWTGSLGWNKDTLYRSPFYNGDSVPLYYYDEYVFVAKNLKAKSYRWTVGLEPRVGTESTFKIQFGSYEGKIDIRLIIEFDLNDPCNKAKTQFDTIVKTFYLIPSHDNPNYKQIGKYKITNVGVNREFEITYSNYYCDPRDRSNVYEIVMRNIIDSAIFRSNTFNGMHICTHELYFMYPGTCRRPLDTSSNACKGIIRFKQDSIDIQYHYLLPTYGANYQITSVRKSPLYQFQAIKL